MPTMPAREDGQCVYPTGTPVCKSPVRFQVELGEAGQWQVCSGHVVPMLDLLTSGQNSYVRVTSAGNPFRGLSREAPLPRLAGVDD